MLLYLTFKPMAEGNLGKFGGNIRVCIRVFYRVKRHLAITIVILFFF